MLERTRMRWRMFATIIAAVSVVVAGAVWYFRFAREQIYSDSSQSVLSTYEQVDSTFSLFCQRNWNYLSDYDVFLQHNAENPDLFDKFANFANTRTDWRYNDFYLFNGADEFLTASDRSGVASSISGVFNEMYAKNTSTVRTYLSSTGQQMIAFAVPLSNSVEINGTSYTGVAVSYKASVVQELVSAKIYDGCSDAFVVTPSGDVAISLQEKTELTDSFVNLPEYLRAHTEFVYGDAESVRAGIAGGGQGVALVSSGGREDYLAYLPSDVDGYSVVGIVRRDVVEAGAKRLQSVSILSMLGIGCLIICMVVAIIVLVSHRRLAHEVEARRAAEEKGALNRLLFNGVAQIIDRLALVDLVNDTYEYREQQLGKDLYPERGEYRALLAEVSRRYMVLNGDGEVKMGALLSPGRIRRELGRDGDFLKIEYCGRTENAYKVMNVIPVEWGDDGLVSKVMLAVQDIGQKVELRNIANTDGLTGLFNGRCMSEVLHDKERRREPFTLYFLDLDRFKPVNDEYGHDVGDKLLMAVAERLRGCIRSSDYAFRIGGDEFVVAACMGADPEGAAMLKGRLEGSIAKPYIIDGLRIEVGASCGFAAFPEEADTLEGVRVLADQRMYAEKERRHAQR